MFLHVPPIEIIRFYLDSKRKLVFFSQMEGVNKLEIICMHENKTGTTPQYRYTEQYLYRVQMLLMGSASICNYLYFICRLYKYVVKVRRMFWVFIYFFQ